MNNATGKRLLALVSEGDYAHPGEEEANHLLFAGVTATRAAASSTRAAAARVRPPGCRRAGMGR